ncbi:MAG: hypothetical protein KAW17_04785 [Candidatus Eisenbacteria sp.]|nr:hypothetical protein [Candidatus Eisenbacteria bacterium]
MEEIRRQDLVDLDNLYPGVPVSSDSVLPRTTCRIIRRIYDNALFMNLDEIVIDEGYGKCDSARAIASILEDRLPIPVRRTRNVSSEGRGTPVSDSALALREKVEMILSDFVRPVERSVIAEPHPAVAVWGVPCSDFLLYDLFPDGTKILGWTRCFENRTPADDELEQMIDPAVPTVFFAQMFCHKNALAKHLAGVHGGLYLDIDGQVTLPIRAKVEAFLHFRVGNRERGRREAG